MTDEYDKTRWVLTVKYEDRILASMPVKVEDMPGGLRIVIWRANDLLILARENGGILASIPVVWGEKPLLLELIETDR